MNEIPLDPPQTAMTPMLDAEPALTLRLARDRRDLQAAQRLRYEVFVEELGARGRGWTMPPGWSRTSSIRISNTCC